MLSRLGVLMFLLASGSVAAEPFPARLKGSPLFVGPLRESPQFGACYFYSGGLQRIRATGASVTFEVPAVVVPPGSDHSLFELAVLTASGHIVEIGAIAGFGTGPQLFVFHWVRSVPTCYDGCGWVARPDAPIQVGAPLQPGSVVTVAWAHRQDGWYGFVDGEQIGHFPSTEWASDASGFTASDYVEWFGEVAVPPVDPCVPACVPMGTGILGGARGAARAYRLRTYNGRWRSARVKSVGNPVPSAYRFKRMGPARFAYGGPGRCP